MGILVKGSEPLAVAFGGPFSWPGTADAPCVFECQQGKSAGVYLWAIAHPEGYLVYYVGETGRSFAQRLLEHYREHASAFYHLNSPKEFTMGERVAVWPGRYDVTEKRSPRECVARYEQLAPCIIELTAIYRFFLAPLAVSDRECRRIEAALAAWLYAQPGVIGGFQEKGIRYAPRLADEEPIRCEFTSSAPIQGLPDHLLV